MDKWGRGHCPDKEWVILQEQRNNRRQIDDITSLFNMNHFLEDATVLLRGSEDGEFAVIYFDIENFKAYNQA